MTQDGKTDLRVQKTERALMEALLRLLKEKPMERITVSDLCNEAMIRRATFYTHFKDKYDFLDFCLMRKQAQYDQEAMCNADAAEHYVRVIRDMLRYFQENRALLDHVLGSGDASPMTALFERQIKRTMQARAERITRDGVELPAPPEVVAAYVSGALLGVVRWWFTSEADIPEDELVRYIQRLITATAQALMPCQTEATQQKNDMIQPEQGSQDKGGTP